MTDCNGCGSCCDPVNLPVSPADIAAMRETKMHAYGRRTTDNRTLAWMGSLVLIAKRWTGRGMTYLYRCPSYDPVGKRCLDYGMRPRVCSGYPFYGKEPSLDVSMGAHCSFIPDAVKLLPIVDVR